MMTGSSPVALSTMTDVLCMLCFQHFINNSLGALPDHSPTPLLSFLLYGMLMRAQV